MTQRDGDVRSLFESVGGAALGIAFGLGVLIFGYVVSRVVLPDNVIDASTVGSPIVAATQSAPARATVATIVPGASPTAAVRPTTTPDPLVVTGFSGQGLRL